MSRLKVCPDGSASTAWDYYYPLCNLYRDAGPNHCRHSQTSCAQSPFDPFYAWSNMLLTGLHHSPVASIPLLLPSNSSILPLHLPPLLPSLTCRRVRDNHHQWIDNYWASVSLSNILHCSNTLNILPYCVSLSHII